MILNLVLLEEENRFQNRRATMFRKRTVCCFHNKKDLVVFAISKMRPKKHKHIIAATERGLLVRKSYHYGYCLNITN